MHSAGSGGGPRRARDPSLDHQRSGSSTGLGARSRARRLALPFLLLVGTILVFGMAFAGAAPNNAPTVVTSGGTLAYTEDDGAVVWDGGILVDDIDLDPIQGATVQISAGYVAGEDLLASAGGGGISASWNGGSGILSLSGAAPASTYQIVLRQVTYENASESPTAATRTVSVTVTDGIDPSASASRDVAVTSVHDNPALSFTGGSLAYVEDSGAVPIDAAAIATDAEDDITTASFQITGGYVAAEDALGFVDAFGIVGSWNAGTGTLTLTGAATSASWQSAIRAVTYTNTSANPTTPPRTVSATISDGTVTTPSVNRVIAITTVNDPPDAGGDTTVVAPGGGAVSVPEDTPAPGAPNIRLVPPTLSDVEGPVPAAVRILSVVGGTLTQGDGSTIGLGTGGSIITLTGGGVDLRFTPAAERDTDASFGYTVVDGVNPGINSTASTATIDIAPVNDAPQLVVSGGAASFVENGAPVAVDPGATVADIDNATLAGASVVVTGGYVNGEDTLAGTSGGGITVSWAPATGTLTLSGSASLASYELALRAVTYTNPSENPAASTRTISVTLDDGTTPSSTLTRNLTVTPANDAPAVTTSGGSTSYTENSAAVVIDPGITVSDVDNLSLGSATVQITGGHVAAEDMLAAASGGGISVGWNAGTGTLTLSGAAPISAYEAALRAVTYVDTSDDPDTGARTITVSVDDGAAGSTGATHTVTIVAQNDAPTLAGGGGIVTFTENDAGRAVVAAVTIADLDDASITGATATIAGNFAASEDVLALANQAGITGSWSPATGTLALSGTASIAAYEAALEAVEYTNTSEDPTTATRSVEVAIDDGTDPSNSISADVVVVPVNDKTSVGMAAGSVDFTENDPDTPIDDAATVSEPDDPQIDRVEITTISGWRASEDTLVATPSGGISVSYDASIGRMVLSGPAPAAAFETVLRTVRYSNPSDDPTGGSRRFSIVADDGSGDGPAAERVLIVTAVNDSPAAADDVAELLQGEFIEVDVLQNDTDPEGHALTIKSWSEPPDAVVAKTDGRLKVDPDNDFVGGISIVYRAADGHAGTDTARLRVRVRAAADGSIRVHDSPDPVTAGGDLTETVTVRNAGPGVLEHAVVRLRAPAASLLDVAKPDGVSCTKFPHHWACDLGDLDSDTAMVLRFMVRPPAEGIVSARATLTHGSVDPDTLDLVDVSNTYVRPGATTTTTTTNPPSTTSPPSPTSAPGSTAPPTSTTDTDPSTASETTTSVATTTTQFDDTIDDIETSSTAASPDTGHADTSTSHDASPVAADPTVAPTTTSDGGGSRSSPLPMLALTIVLAVAAALLWQRQRL